MLMLLVLVLILTRARPSRPRPHTHQDPRRAVLADVGEIAHLLADARAVRLLAARLGLDERGVRAGVPVVILPAHV